MCLGVAKKPYLRNIGLWWNLSEDLRKMQEHFTNRQTALQRSFSVIQAEQRRCGFRLRREPQHHPLPSLGNACSWQRIGFRASKTVIYISIQYTDHSTIQYTDHSRSISHLGRCTSFYMPHICLLPSSNDWALSQNARWSCCHQPSLLAVPNRSVRPPIH